MKKVVFILTVLMAVSQIIYGQNRDYGKSVIVSGGVARYHNSYLTEAAATGYNFNLEWHRYTSNRVYLLGVVSYFGKNRTKWYDISAKEFYPARKDIKRMDIFAGVGIGMDFLRLNRHTFYGQLAAGANMHKMGGKIEFLNDKSPINDSTPASDISTRELDNKAKPTWQAQLRLGYNYQLNDRLFVGLSYLGNILGETHHTFTDNVYEKNVCISGFDIKLGYSF